MSGLYTSRFFRIIGLAFGLSAILSATPTHAEIAPSVLDKEYETCAADGKDTERNAYCACVRDQMREWSEQDFMTVAQSASTPNSPVPEKLMDVAKQCIAQVMH